MKMKRVLVFSLLACCLYVLSAKDREWLTGKVVEISDERFGVGNTGKLAVALGQPHATHDKGVEYTIQSGEYSYIAAEMSMAHHKLKEERVALNDAVKFALQGETKLILMGNDGKEHSLQLLKRTTRAAAETPKP